MRVLRSLSIILFFLAFLLPLGATVAKAEQDVAATLAALRSNPKLSDPGDILADFDNGASETAVIVLLEPAAEAKALAAESLLSSKVPPLFTRPGAATYYNLQDEYTRTQLIRSVTAKTSQVLSHLGATGITLSRTFSYQFGFSAKVTPAALERIVASPEVLTVEKDRVLQLYSAQGITLMNGAAARSTYTGSGVSIAICDSGIDTSHIQLGGSGFPNAKVVGGYDIGDDDADPRPDPLKGQAHGTACAGIAAGNTGTTDDYIGGVAPGANLYAIKIFTDSGEGRYSTLLAGWEWAITHKNDDPNNPILMISTSSGSGAYPSACDSASPSMTAAAANAVAAGISVFAAAGNDGSCGSLALPGCISYVNSVGAVYDADLGTMTSSVGAESCAPKSPAPQGTGWQLTEKTAPDQVAGYSNSAPFLTLLAPAHNAYAPDIVGAGGFATGEYTYLGGTSAASSYATGAAALLQQAAKVRTGSYLTPAEVTRYLVDTGDLITDTKSGVTKPRINLGRAIDALAAPATVVQSAPEPTPTANTGFATLTSGYTLSGTVRQGSAAGPVLAGAKVAIAGKTALTGSTGAFVITAIPAGTYTLTVSKTGYLTKTVTGYVVNSNKTAQVFYMTPLYTFSGTVRQGSATGPVLAGANVAIAGKAAVTGSTGAFALSAIPAGTYTLVISKPGYLTKTVTGYVVNSNKTAQLFYLTPLFTLSGTVRHGSATGPVVAGAKVAIAGKAALTGSTGTFAITAIPAGSYTLTISKTGYVTKTTTGYLVNSNKTGQLFYLTPTYTLSGTVRQGSAAGPVLAGATVSIAGKTATTSSTGAFAITAIPAGTYTLTISKSGYATKTTTGYVVNSNKTGQVFYLGSLQGTYRGTADVQIDYYDLLGNFLATHQVRLNAFVVIQQAGVVYTWDGRVIRETNPFSIKLSSNTPPGYYQSEGFFDVSTFLSVKDSWGRVAGAAQYWDISVSGKSFTGTLSDTYGMALLPYPYANMLNAIAGPASNLVVSLRTITQGATLTGTADGSSARFVVEGDLAVKNNDATVPFFKITFVGTKQ